MLSNVFTTVGWSVNPTDYACRGLLSTKRRLPDWAFPKDAGQMCAIAFLTHPGFRSQAFRR